MCHTIVKQLRKWSKRTLKSLPFGADMAWQELQNHVDHCYFCLSKVRCCKAINLKYISYLLEGLFHMILMCPPDSMDTIVLSEEESDKETISESDIEIKHKIHLSSLHSVS
ncbi:hypothetical protein T08_2459 [Trichinella sp. T8]|nr:hypothetical protein T08_2459 [Trichinella sp. T8]